MTDNSRIKLYVDLMILEALSSNEGLSKTAQSSVASDIISKVHHYASNQIDPAEDKTSTALRLLGPGLIWTTLRMIGLPWWFTTLISLAAAVFHIDVGAILRSIYDKIKGAVGSGQKISSSQVDSMVSSSVQEHVKPATEEEADEAQKTLQSKSYSMMIREVKLFKLALSDYNMIKTAQKSSGIGSLFSRYSARKSVTGNILSTILSLIFKVVLASAGLMVAGDVINKFLGRPSALDDTIQKGKPVTEPTTTVPTVPTVTTTQTKFPVNPSYHEEHFNTSGNNWIVNITNNKSSIEDLLIGFAKDVYKGLDGQESNIRSTAGFQSIADTIEWYNHTSAGGPVVFLPRMFTSKKKIVDHFIDDVAEKAG